MADYTYDVTDNQLDDGTTAYEYDVLNRLAGRDATNYSYNDNGVLVDGGSTKYTQNLAASLTQILHWPQGVTTTTISTAINV